MTTYGQPFPTVGSVDFYIPRVNRTRASLQFISSVFLNNRIGHVEHVDFVEINANQGFLSFEIVLVESTHGKRL